MIGVPSRVTLAAARALLRHPWQLVLSLFGIAVGVAVVVAIDLASGSARRALAIANDGIAGRATHRIIGGPRGVPEQLYVDLRLANLGVTLAPVIETRVVTIVPPGYSLTVLGLDPFVVQELRDTESASTLLEPTVLTPLLTTPGAVVLSADTARELGISIGAVFQVRAGARSTTLTLAGTVAPRGPLAAEQIAEIAIADIATGQELNRTEGQLSRIDVILPEGAASAPARRRIESRLTPGTRLVDTNERRHAAARLTHAFDLNLRMLGLLAIVIGAFLILNTMTFSVVRRRWLIGILRCLGVTRIRIFGLVLTEAAVVGCVGTLIGLGLGFVLAQGLVGFVVQSINDHYFAVQVGSLHASPAVFGRAALIGVSTALVTTVFPAMEAAWIPPKAVLARATLEAGVRSGASRLALIAVVLIAGGGVIVMLSERSIGWGFAALLAVIAGAALLTPAITLAVVSHTAAAARGWGAGWIALSVRGVGANLSRSGIAVAALMITVASTIGVGVMVYSFRITVGAWLDETLRADFYLGAPGGGESRSIDPSIIEALRTIPGVAELSLGRRARVESDRGPVTVFALEAAAPSYRAFTFVEGNPAIAWPRFDRGEAVLVSEPLAWHRRIGFGDTITLLTANGLTPYRIAGVYRDYASDRGELLMSRGSYTAAWGDTTVTGVGIYLEPEGDAQAVMTAVRAILPTVSTLAIHSNHAIREASLVIFDRTFAITAVLRVLAMAVSFVGVLSALMAIQFERRREIGVLRVLGLSRSQLIAHTELQTAMMGGIAGLLAVPTGLAMAWILVEVINRRSFGWRIEFSIDPVVLAQAVALALAAALIAGIGPALRMSRTDLAQALRDD